jgi:hypothetical protein
VATPLRPTAFAVVLLFNGLERALERRKTRQIRERIARELAELEAARQKRDRVAT